MTLTQAAAAHAEAATAALYAVDHAPAHGATAHYWPCTCGVLTRGKAGHGAHVAAAERAREAAWTAAYDAHVRAHGGRL